MIISRLPKFVAGALNAVLAVVLILLWANEYPWTIKIAGTAALLVVAGLVGWWGAAIRAWLRDKKRFD